MTLSGGGVYMANVPADHFARSNAIWYYIEAVDDSDEWAETSWHQVLVKGTEPAPAPAPVARPATRPVVQPAVQPVATTPSPQRTVRSLPPEEKRGVPPAAIVGGAVLVGGGVIAAIASSGGGGGGGGSSTTTTTMDDGGGTTPTPEPVTCLVDEAIGTWSGPNATIAPGFSLASNGSANFVLPDGAGVDAGSWSLSDCVLTLIPSGTNTLYRGSGTISDDKMRVTVNQIQYIKDQ
jgi:hypothetical protein